MEHADHDCSSHSGSSSVHQTLDELEFERGIWSAALNGDLDDVERHINRGTDVNKRDKSGYSALHYASRNGHLQVVRRLLEAGADVKAVTRSGGATPLHRAAYMGHTDIVSHLLGRGAKPMMVDADGMTPLHKAVERNHAQCVRTLVKACPDAVDVKDKRGRLPADCTADNAVKSLCVK